MQEREKSHRFPHFLPGGKAILFTITAAEMTSYDEAQVGVLSLDTGQHRVLLDGGTNPHYAPTGHLVYVRGASLFAAPLDVDRLEVTAPPVPVLDGISTSVQFGSAEFSVAQNGLLAYIRGSQRESGRSVVWVDRGGQREPAIDAQRAFYDVRVSPDAGRLAVVVAGNNDHVWLYDLKRRALTRMTFAWDNIWPAWTPDGMWITFSSNQLAEASDLDRAPGFNVYSVRSDGSGQAQRLTDSSYSSTVGSGSWSPDGKVFAFGGLRSGGYDILAVTQSSASPRNVQPLLHTPFNELYPRFSPDGRWLAYISDESGRWEVYVRPFPNLNAKWQVSTGGGSLPTWEARGRELFFQNGSKMMAVGIRTDTPFMPGAPRLLFEGSYIEDAFDVAPDGRFIMIQASPAEDPPTQITIVQNFLDELIRRIAVN
jgi:serine/threonine-protein kinase